MILFTTFIYSLLFFIIGTIVLLLSQKDVSFITESVVLKTITNQTENNNNDSEIQDIDGFNKKNIHTSSSKSYANTSKSNGNRNGSRHKSRNKTDVKVVSMILPSQMKIKYYEMWNHNTSTINIPEEYRHPFGMQSNTSLEILQYVLHDEKYQDEYLAVDEYMKGESEHIPQCLLPNLKATQDLVNEIKKKRQARRNNTTNDESNKKHESTAEKNLLIDLPILNVGYPKDGSYTLYDYFKCIGLYASHGQNGLIMFEHAREGKSVFEPRNRKKEEEKNKKKAVNAFLQLDFNFGVGFYPHISLLDEMHEEKPNSTFIMNFRPVKDWIRSVKSWNIMMERMSRFLIPGLLRTEEQFENTDRGRHKLNTIMKFKMARWWCGHVNHIREYARQYPSHKFIELDLYDTDGTSKVLHDLMEVDTEASAQTQQCWGHSNGRRRSGNNKHTSSNNSSSNVTSNKSDIGADAINNLTQRLL